MYRGDLSGGENSATARAAARTVRLQESARGEHSESGERDCNNA